MNQILISIGSNFDAAHQMAAACLQLERTLPVIRWSEIMRTQPVDCVCQVPFLNRVGWAQTTGSIQELQSLFKQLERRAGRTQEGQSRGIIPLDIDLLQWNEIILKPADLTRPYVQSALLSLNITHK